ANEKIQRTMKKTHDPKPSRLYQKKDDAMKRPVHSELQDASYKKMISVINRETGLDLSRYKRATVQRRIIRRLAIKRMKDVPSYLRYLKKDQQEMNLLIEDILIHVTEFFRDSELFSILQKKVFPELVKQRTPG